MFALPNLRLRLAAVVLVMASIFTGAAAMTSAPAEASDSTCVHSNQWITFPVYMRFYNGHGGAGWSHKNYYRHATNVVVRWEYGSQYSVTCPYN